MARYIDADELLNKLPDDLPYKASVKRVLMQAPEADVVPKSEIEAYVDLYKSEMVKAVAREIFEEIERVVGEKYNHYVFGNNDLDSIEQDAIINLSDTLLSCFAELKKKYTEGYNDG